MMMDMEHILVEAVRSSWLATEMTSAVRAYFNNKDNDSLMLVTYRDRVLRRELDHAGMDVVARSRRAIEADDWCVYIKPRSTAVGADRVIVAGMKLAVFA